MQRGDQVFPYFMATWLVLMAAGYYFFYRNPNVEFKRKYYPWALGGVGVLFLVFLWLMGFPPQTFILAIPAMILITFLNIRGTRFCVSCGRTIVTQGIPWSRPEFCPSCGAKIDED